MEGFYVTNKGVELINQAVKNGTKVEITKAKFGSGADISGARNYDITTLAHEEYSKGLDSLTDSYEINEKDGKTLVIKTILPAEVVCTVNEIGYFDSSDNLIIYGIVRDEEKRAGVPHQYINWVKFDNLDDSKVEITVISPEYEKVEKLVETTKTEFDSRLENVQTTVTEIVERAENEFNLDNYPTKEDLKQITDKIGEVDIKQLDSKVTTLEGKVGEVDISELDTKVKAIETKIGQTDISELESKVTTMESEHQQILEALNKWV